MVDITTARYVQAIDLVDTQRKPERVKEREKRLGEERGREGMNGPGISEIGDQNLEIDSILEHLARARRNYDSAILMRKKKGEEKEKHSNIECKT